MKKWLIILSIIFTIGFISTAALAGRVYYEDLKVYSDYDKKELEKNSLKNIYIKSDIPVEVYPTTGVPYVEFEQNFSDLIGAAPEYELKVQAKGESTYIELGLVKDVFVWLGVKENTARLSVYLPESTINRLSIQEQSYYIYNRGHNQVINLEGINVNEVDISTNTGEFILDGSYNRIKIDSRGTLNLNSKKPVELYVNRSMNQYLSGQFEKIMIENNNGTEIVIDSELATQVFINNNSGHMDLRGNYKKVKLQGNNNSFDLRSNTICTLNTEGSDNTIIANGPFEEMSFSENYSDLEIKTTAIPNKLMLGNGMSYSKLSLTLPSNIPGFKVKYQTYYDLEENINYETYYDLEENINYFVENPLDTGNLQSEFELKEKVVEKSKLIFAYGNGALEMNLDVENGNSLEILDGGYSSTNQTTAQ